MSSPLSLPKTPFLLIIENLCVYEMRDPTGVRRFGLAVADHLPGPWSNVTDNYAGGSLLDYLAGANRWTEEVSHGEMIRTGFDQHLEYDPDRSRFLVQGMLASQHKGPYPQLVWKLGIIKKKPTEK